MIVADANVVIAASTPGHVHHATAQQIVVEHGRAGIALHSLTLAEVLVGPARVGDETRASLVLAAAGFRPSAGGDPSPERLARVRTTSGLTMPDACVLALAEHLGTPLATFDKRLARAATARGVVVLGAAGEGRS